MFNNTTPNRLKGVILDSLGKTPMTLADLHTSAKVSLPTMRRALNELMEAGWVTIVGRNPSTGGRPAKLFGLNGASHMIIGVDVEIPAVNLVLVEINGNVIDQRCLSIYDDPLPDNAVDIITRYVDEIRARYPERNLLGIGMAAPGYVDPSTGEILFVGRLPRWRNYPMKSRLETHLNLPVIMENATDCMIRAEIDHAEQPIDGDVIYLAVVEGVKVSMLLNGHLHKGKFGNAGLIGRTKLCADCLDLEETASVGGVCSTFDRRVRMTKDETLAQIASLTDRNEKFQAVLAAGEAGNPLCAEIVNQMIDDLTLAVCNVLYILQPTTLIIGGQFSDISAGLAARLERGIRDQMPPLLSNHLLIKYASVTGRYAAASGATRWFLKRFIAMETTFSDISLSG